MLIFLNYICDLKYLLLFYFISKNVKGIKPSEKRLKLFEYLRNKINNNDFIFLQETHLSSKDEQKWKDDFRDLLFFSHGKSNSCGVAIGYCGTEAFKVVTTVCDKNGPILTLDGELNGTTFYLSIFTILSQSLSSYLLSPLCKNYLKMLMIMTEKTIIFGGEFNLIFDCNFDASGGNPILKKKSLAKLLEIKEALYLCDICRIRNPNVRRFTFRKKHVSSFIEQRLDFFVISNILKESIIKLTFLLLFVPIIRQYFSLYN